MKNKNNKYTSPSQEIHCVNKYRPQNSWMPFKSKSQLRTCYGKRSKLQDSSTSKGWDCDKWLAETPSICNLPEKFSQKTTKTTRTAKSTNQTKTRNLRKGERIVGKVQTGARGGKFFIITERDARGKECTMKVYVSKNT